ncbi:tRNA (adenosine(37)-N6)-threonylcarbamoyltransferase complex ATPase subunit type 1 TsaE [Verrucomicrobiota bacterium]
MNACSKGPARRRIVSDSPEHTRGLANSLLDQLVKGSVLSLHGELGSGKTCFVQGLADALNVRQAVTSPSYTIINEYAGRWSLYHIDLYRVHSPEEALRLGLEDYLVPDGITAIEWGERAEDLLPENTIHITFELLPKQDARAITIESYFSRARE